MREIFVRFDRCVGCRSCELACAVAHSQAKSLVGAIGEIPRPRRRLYVERLEGRNVPFLCRHCEDAPCVKSCQTGALSQDPLTGVVSHHPTRCVGCWLCVMVCPYGVISREEERRIAVKCDRCIERSSPACVDACPTRALVFVEEEAYARMIRRESLAQVLPQR